MCPAQPSCSPTGDTSTDTFASARAQASADVRGRYHRERELARPTPASRVRRASQLENLIADGTRALLPTLG